MPASGWRAGAAAAILAWCAATSAAAPPGDCATKQAADATVASVFDQVELLSAARVIRDRRLEAQVDAEIRAHVAAGRWTIHAADTFHANVERDGEFKLLRLTADAQGTAYRERLRRVAEREDRKDAPGACRLARGSLPGSPGTSPGRFR